jgi:4-carboxymuconolactone decarboxylase
MRLPLVRRSDVTAEQRALYEAFEQATQAEEYQGFEVRDSEGRFVGPWGVLLHFPALARPLAQFVNLAQQLTDISERARQVVILTIAGHFNVAYELYAHRALGLRAGLRPDQVAALSAGTRPGDLAEDEALAAEVAEALARGGVVPGPLYDTAVGKLGQRGFDAVVFITIHYLALGTLLNAYDVPAGEPAVTHP